VLETYSGKPEEKPVSTHSSMRRFSSDPIEPPGDAEEECTLAR
jgi:hypothetical protein